MSLNASFKVVAWRGTTNIADGIMGIGFDHADGEITRLALNVESARALADTVTAYLDSYAVRMNAQSPISPDFPSRDDGPPKRSWSPCVAACGLGTQNGKAYKFSVKTEDGVMHRFLINRSHACWLAATFVDALFPRAGKLLAWLLYRESRKTRQSAMSSGNVKRDGSPHEGHAV